jgi:hypothetical protein
MKTSKIKSFEYKNSFSTQNGEMYSFNIEMENGDKGQINSKSKEPDWGRVGSDISYSVKREHPEYGPTFKRETQGGFGGKKNYSNVGQAVGMALNRSVDMFIADKIKSDQVESMAQSILDKYINLCNKNKSKIDSI